MRARDVMSRTVRTVGVDSLVRDAARVLSRGRISALPVVDRRRRVVGIVSEGDLLRRPETGTEKRRSWWLDLLTDSATEARRIAKSRAVRVRDVMTQPVVSVTPGTDLREVADLLERWGIKRVPVMRGARLVGIVSRRDLVRAFAKRGRAGAGRKLSDAQLRAALHRELKKLGWLDGALINFAVTKGVVELSGLATSGDQRTALRVLAEGLPGVRAVKSRMGLMPPPAAI